MTRLARGRSDAPVHRRLDHRGVAQEGVSSAVLRGGREGDLEAPSCIACCGSSSCIRSPSPAITTAADAPAARRWRSSTTSRPSTPRRHALRAAQPRPRKYQTSVHWLTDGSPRAAPRDPPDAAVAEAVRWEAFLNGDRPEARLMSRYIYEHLFLAPSALRGLRASRTSSTGALENAAGRADRADRDAQARTTIRKVPASSTACARISEALSPRRTMPYALDDARLAKFHALFLDRRNTRVERCPPTSRGRRESVRRLPRPAAALALSLHAGGSAASPSRASSRVRCAAARWRST